MATNNEDAADADGVTLAQKMLSATTGSVLTSLLGTCERVNLPCRRTQAD